LIDGNFEIVQSGFFSYSELERMMPFEWDIYSLLVQRKMKMKNEMIEKGK